MASKILIRWRRASRWPAGCCRRRVGFGENGCAAPGQVETSALGKPSAIMEVGAAICPAAHAVVTTAEHVQRFVKYGVMMATCMNGFREIGRPRCKKRPDMRFYSNRGRDR